MKYLFLAVALVAFSSCMKSKEDYREAISGIQEEQATEREADKQMQEERAAERRNMRARGSNDAEGMGMDE